MSQTLLSVFLFYATLNTVTFMYLTAKVVEYMSWKRDWRTHNERR